MNTDIRLSVDFFSHHKTKRVARMFGHEGVVSLITLFCYAGKFRSDGVLKGMDAEDIAGACGWGGPPTLFVEELCSTGFLEKCEEGIYQLHDWEHHNPWACGAMARSEAASKAGRASAEKRAKSTRFSTDVERGVELPLNGRYERIGNDRSTPSPSPSPSPSPLPIEQTHAPGGAGEIKTESCPHQEIIDIYHDALPSAPRIRIWNDSNRAALRSRWREDKTRQSLEWWRGFFLEVAKSDFLTGRTGKGFTASLDWIIKASNFAKIINGNYINRGGGAAIPSLKCKGSCDYGVRGHCDDRTDNTCATCTAFKPATI